MALFPAALASATPAPSTWPQTGSNAAASNANLGESTLTSASIGRAVVLKTIAAQGQDCNGLPATFSPPVLDASKIYSANGTVLTAFDARSRAEVWHRQLPLTSSDHTGPVAVSQGLLVVAGNNCSVDNPIGDVRAFRAGDGAPAWVIRLPYGDGLIDVSVSGDYVVVETGVYTGTARELSVFCLQDGHLVWTVAGSYSGNGLGSGVIADASARVVRGKVFVQAFDATGYPRQQARALATGAVVWTRPVNAQVERGDADTAGGHVLFTIGGGNIDPATGRLRYRLNADVRTLAVDPSRVYGVRGADETIVSGYEQATGRQLWTRQLPSYVKAAFAAGGLLYLSTGQVLNAATGQLVRTLAGTPTAVAQGRVTVELDSGALSVYGLPGS